MMKTAFTLLLCFGLTFMAAAQTVTFAEYKERGDKCFAKADYDCARNNYERALRIRSDDIYCKSQLKKTAEAEERKKRERLKKKELERSEKEQTLKEQEAEKLRLAEAARLEQEQQARLKAEQEKAAQAAEAAKLAFVRTNYPKTTDEDKDGIPWPFDACPVQKGEIRHWGCPTPSQSGSQWSQYANGEIPADALVLGKTSDGKRRFLARAGVGLLGYIDEGQKEATIGAGNLTINVYDVLPNGAFKWVKPSPELYISGKAMPRSEVSTTNFIARFVSKKQVAAGVANPSNSHALFFDDNSDFRTETYEVLMKENAPVGILHVKKHKSIAVSSLTLLINGIQTSYGVVELKPGQVEMMAQCKDKKKKTLTTDKVTWVAEANQTYKYVLGQLANGTIALVEESKQGIFELAAH